MGSLDGQVVLVTGSRGTLGSVLTWACADAGAIVVGCGRSAVTSWGERSAFVKCDLVRSPIGQMLDDILLHYGRLDAIISNAAQLKDGTLASYYTVNAMVPILLLDIAVERVGKGLKKFIQISGGGATGPANVPVGYAMSKAAVVRGMEMQASVYPDVAINCLAPGDLTHQSAVVAAECAVWLLSPAAQGLTGKLIAAQWDHWRSWCNPEAIKSLMATDVLAVRRKA